MKKYFGLSEYKIFSHRLKCLVSNFRYKIKHILPNTQLISHTKKLKGTQKDKNIFVFGNGPSMQKLSPEKISKYQKNENFHVMAVNSFLYTEFSKFITPTYMVFSDPLDFVDVDDNHPRAERARTGKLDKLRAIDKGITTCVPIQFRYYHDYENTIWFNDLENIFSNNAADITKPRGYTGWTGMKALAIACYLGYKNIYICGMDYDMFKKLSVDVNNDIYFETAHFYADDERPNYILPQGAKRPGGSRTLAELLYLISFHFKVHEKFKKYPIVNLNPEGLIDSFTKHHNLDVYDNI